MTERPTLFQTGDFTLRSGVQSAWKIECDALTLEDWRGLAAMAVERLPPFGRVEGVPRGGLPFADALQGYRRCKMCGHTWDAHLHYAGWPAVSFNPPCSSWVAAPRLLIAEDVVTTGGSMERFRVGLRRSEDEAVGVAAFGRGDKSKWPLWVTVLGDFFQEMRRG